MTEAKARRRVDWGHLTLVLFFAVITSAYLADAWSASAKFKNLVLVLPASVLSLFLCLIVAWSALRHGADPSDESPAGDTTLPVTLLDRFRPAILMALFALYILTLPWLGFDVGSAAFVAAALLLDGERRITIILPVSILFAYFATLIFGWLLPYPMPLLIM
jgi:hypothetical protein